MVTGLKDPECPRNAKGTAAMTGGASVASPGPAASVNSPETSSEHAAMSAALEQMMKDEQHRQSARAYMAAVCDAAGSVGTSREFVTLVNASDDMFTARMVVDLGCLRSVAGIKWVLTEVQRCKQQGRYFAIKPTLDYFRFGDGVRRPSRFRAYLEVGTCRLVGN